MEGVTHAGFRHLIAGRPGLGVVCTEFVRIAGVPLNPAHLRRQVVKSPGVALSVQVMGNDISNLAEATRIVAAAGADLVDLNVGCPAPRAVRKGVGSALLGNRELLARVVRAMRQSTEGVLSAKIRAGFEDASGAVATARIIEDCGADLLTVHPRRRVDFYRGVADWRIIEAIKSALRIPVVGNGDVWYAQDARRMRHQTGCDGVMIGRGALRNPWIFEQLSALERGLTPPVVTVEMWLDHFEALAATLAESHPRGRLGMLKEQLRYLARGLHDGADFARHALRAQSVEALLEAVRRRAERPGTGFDLAAEGGELERSGSTSAPATPLPRERPTAMGCSG